MDVSDKLQISTLKLAWARRLDSTKELDLTKILATGGLSLSQLDQAGNFVKWPDYLNILDQLHQHLRDDEIVEAGRESWQLLQPPLNRLFYSTTEQYQVAFSAESLIARSYPLSVSTVVAGDGRINIQLTLPESATPSRSFLLYFLGEIMGLAEIIDGNPARVDFQSSREIAFFQVICKPASRLQRQRQSFASLFDPGHSQSMGTRHQDLQRRYVELEQETIRLRKAEEDALLNERRYRLLADHLQDMLFTFTPSLEISYASPSVERQLLYPLDVVTQLGLNDLFTTSSVELFRLSIEEMITSGKGLGNLELEMYQQDGSALWVELTANVMRDQYDRTLGILTVARNINQRKQMEREIQEREENYRVITTTARDGILSFNDDLAITFVNPSVARIFGYPLSELIGQPASVLIPDLKTVSLDGQDHRQSVELVMEGLHKDQSRIPLEISFSEQRQRHRRFYTGIIRDITARKRIETEREELERQLLASQKMESIGQLAGGVAHDFNNLLVAILGYADLALEPELPPPDLRSYINEIRLAGERAADMTQKLLAFSRRQIMSTSQTNLGELVSGIDQLLHRLLPENIDFHYSQPEESVEVIADAGQLEQVIINLAVNARDAMTNGGVLHIKLVTTIIDSDFIQIYPWANEGHFACLSITDSGSGMNEDLTKRIFEPFFTTKPEGSGTGLGLAVVFGIVKQHEGFVQVESTPGVGTTFRVFLPLSQYGPRALPKHHHSPIAGGDETILVVEDNHQVRELARLILLGAGYTVLLAADGREAIDLFVEQYGEIDLVLMDVVMPTLSGEDVMREMHNIHPVVPILFTSGYSPRAIHNNFILEEGLDFIQKPYTSDSLRRKIRELLDNDHKHITRVQL